MRITFHVKDFTVTIVIKRRKSGNRHPAGDGFSLETKPILSGLNR